MQVYVVDNLKKGTIYVFDNHDAALRCRREQKLDQNHLRGCGINSDWQDGQPILKTA